MKSIFHSYKFIFLLLKIVIYIFVTFFTLITLFVFGFLFYLSSNEICLSSQTTIMVITKIIDLKKDTNISFSFSSVCFKQTSIKDMQFNAIFNDFSILHEKTKLLISNIGNIEVVFSPKEAIFGQFIPKINELSNKTIHLPVSKNNNVNTNSTKSSLNDMFKNTSLMIQKILQNTKLLLTNGIVVKNTTVNMLDLTESKKISSIKVKDFYIQTTAFNSLNKKQKKEFGNLLSKTTSYTTNNNSSVLSKVYTKVLELNNRYMNDVTVYKIVIDYLETQISISGICEYHSNGSLSSCTINIKNMPFALLKKFSLGRQYLQNIMQHSTFNGNIYSTFTDEGIKDFVIDGNVDLFKKNNIIKITSKQIKNIKFMIKTSNNITQINNASFYIYDDKSILVSNISTKNAHFDNGLLKNSDVYFTLNNIKLSHFYNLISQTSSIGKNIKQFDCVIDGTLVFSFDKQGQISDKQTNLKNKIKLKHLMINSKVFDFDISKLLFTLEVKNKNLILKTINLDKDNIGGITIQYDFLKKRIDAKFDKMILTKSNFNQLKQAFFDATQFNIMKNIELSLLLDGYVSMSLDRKSLIKNSFFDLKINVLSTDNDDSDDEIFIKIYKNKSSKKGNIEVDFGKSIMYSQMFAFEKQETDKSVISGTFELIDGKKEIGLKANTSWMLNGDKKSTFTLRFVDRNVYVLLKSKLSKFEISQIGKSYKAEVSGTSVYIDYEFWHVILLLFSMLKDYEVMQIYLDVDDGAIQDVKLDDVRFLINIKPPFFYGHFDFNMHYQGIDYYNMHFVNDKDGTYNVNIPNILPMFTLYDFDITKLPFYKLSLSGEGKCDINNKMFDGNLNINFDTENSGLIGFTKLYSFNIPVFRYNKNGLIFQQAQFNAKWFEAKNIDIALLFNKTSHLNADLVALIPFISKKRYVPVKMTGDTLTELFSKININQQEFKLDKNLQTKEIVKAVIG